MSPTSSAAPQTLTYAIDPAHSTVEFIVRHMMISKVRGRFSDLEGTIELRQGSDLPLVIRATVNASSIDTRESQRDTHLKSGDFFDVEKHAQLRFTSKRIEGTPQEFHAYGDLTMHGVTREIDLIAQFEGRGTDPWGGTRVAYSAHATVDRKDFGLTWNQALETGGFIVSDEVRIELNVEAVLKQ